MLTPSGVKGYRGLCDDSMDMEARQQLLSVMFFGTDRLLSDEQSIGYYTLLEQAVPGYSQNRCNAILQQQLRIPGPSITWQLAELAVGLLSNNILEEEGISQYLR